jgi:hypothetical protein
VNLRLSYPLLAAGLPLGALVAWQLGGAQGAGAMLGVLAALAVSALGMAWQARTASKGRALDGFVLTFLGKLAVLTLGTLSLRYVAVLAESFDWSAYLLGFAAAVVWAMLSTSLGHLRPARIPRSTTP